MREITAQRRWSIYLLGSSNDPKKLENRVSRESRFSRTFRPTTQKISRIAFLENRVSRVFHLNFVRKKRQVNLENLFLDAWNKSFDWEWKNMPRHMCRAPFIILRKVYKWWNIFKTSLSLDFADHQILHFSIQFGFRVGFQTFLNKFFLDDRERQSFFQSAVHWRIIHFHSCLKIWVLVALCLQDNSSYMK